MTRRTRLVSLMALTACAPVQHQEAAPPAPRPPAVTISGTLLAYDGSPMKMAHIHLDGKTHEVDADGSFAVPTRGNRFVWLSSTGVNHGRRRTGLMLGSESVEVDIRLGTVERVEEPEEISLVEMKPRGDGDGFDRGESVSMEARDGGTFAATVDVNGGQLAYEILGISAHEKHSVNGTQADSYAYDGDGDYVSLVHTDAKTVEVVFDRRSLPPGGKRSKATIHAAKGVESQINALAEEMFQFSVARSEAYAAQRRGDPVGDKPTLGSWRQRIEKRLLERQPEMLRHALLIAYFDVQPFGMADKEPAGLHTERWRRQAFDEIPVDSPLWSLSRDSAKQIAEFGRTAFLERLLDEHPDRELVAWLVLDLLAESTFGGHPALQRRYFTRMVEEFEGTRAYERFEKRRRQYDPDVSLQVGAPVPQFDLESFDDRGKRLTPATYAGSFLLIELWGTWCTPCVAEMPKMHEVHEELGKQGLKILSIAVHDSDEKVREFRAEKWPMPWDHAVVHDDQADEVMGDFAALGVPTYLLVHPSGMIAALEDSLRGDAMLEVVRRTMGLADPEPNRRK